MTAPALATDGFNGRTYGDTLPDCDLLRAHGWSGHFTAPSVTAINKAADRSGGLDLWKRRTVAEYTIDHTHIWPGIEDHKVNADQWEKTVRTYGDLAGWKGRGKTSVYARALSEYQAAVDAGDKDACEQWHRKLAVDLCAAAPDRHAREKAQQGTDLHKVMEDIAQGRTPVALLPDDQVHIDQVKAWCDAWQPEFIHSEQSVFSRTHGYAGTPDAFVKLPGIGTVVADWKRQPSPYDAVAYQLAPYARADYVIVSGGAYRRVAVPETVGAVVVNFPPDGSPAQVRPVKPALMEQAWDVFLHTIPLHADRNTKYLDDPVDAPAVIPGDPDRRAFLKARIELLRDFYADTGVVMWIAANWPVGIPTLKQADDHTADQLAAIGRLLDRAEAEHEIPFYKVETETTNPNNNSNLETAA